MNKIGLLFLIFPACVLSTFSACKSKRKLQNHQVAEQAAPIDTLYAKCRLDYKSAFTLSKSIKDNEFNYTSLSAKANVETFIDDKEENFDIKIKIKKDSAMLIGIQYALGLEVAKVLITRDSVKMVNYIQKTYFKGNFDYINQLLNTDIDFDLIQAVLFGNSAEFHNEEVKLKPVLDRQNCHYLLSTERKRKLKKILQGAVEIRDELQVMTLNPENFKIINNEFTDQPTGRKFTATYGNFAQKDSVYAPYHVDIEVKAEKKVKIKIDYVRIEKNTAQKLTLNIPAKYDAIQIQKK
jgi:hypothetical protein